VLPRATTRKTDKTAHGLSKSLFNIFIVLELKRIVVQEFAMHIPGPQTGLFVSMFWNRLDCQIRFLKPKIAEKNV
jgi:hypothetical protein